MFVSFSVMARIQTALPHAARMDGCVLVGKREEEGNAMAHSTGISLTPAGPSFSLFLVVPLFPESRALILFLTVSWN